MGTRVWLGIEIIGSLVALTVLGIAVWLDPDPSGLGTHEQLGLPPCGYLVLTGEPCVSCGMTTAFANMAEAKPIAATKANPMGVALFVLTLIAPFWLVHAMITKRDPLRFLSHWAGRLLLPALVAGCILLWILRGA